MDAPFSLCGLSCSGTTQVVDLVVGGNSHAVLQVVSVELGDDGGATCRMRVQTLLAGTCAPERLTCHAWPTQSLAAHHEVLLLLLHV